jgi:pimeloyl-ACP methyl ester carboxylesterase
MTTELTTKLTTELTTTAPPLSRLTLDDGMTLTYRELGRGAPVLLLHGWPTSSYLWRDVMPAIAEHHCVVAVDLPGFGGSDKPDTRYTFDFFERAIDGLLDRLEMDPVALAGHDLGGPVAVHWALRNQDRVSRLALLNTLLYPEFDPSVIDFVRVLRDEERRDELVGVAGLAGIMRLGVTDESVLTEETLAAVAEPFADPAARATLAAAGIGLSRRGFAEIAAGLPSLTMPVRVVYGERDRVLPDVNETMARLAEDVPHAEITPLPDCGHFIQEEAPRRVGELLAEFFAR